MQRLFVHLRYPSRGLMESSVRSREKANENKNTKL